MIDWGKFTPEFYSEKHQQAVLVFNVAFENEIDRERVLEYVFHKILWGNKQLPEGTLQSIELDLRGQKVSFSIQDKWRENLLQRLNCLLYTSPSPRDQRGSRMPSSA